MKKYYYVVYWERYGNAFSHDVHMVPVAFVTDQHPAELVRSWRKRSQGRTIGSWQEISKEDHDAFHKAFNNLD